MKCFLCIAFAAAYSLGFCQEAKPYLTTTPLSEGRQMYGAVVSGDYLYIIGGNIKPEDKAAEKFTESVEKARINADGTLGAWEPTTPLPEPRSYINNTTLENSNVIYVVQGLNGEADEKTRTILWSRPRPDGHLEPWAQSPQCPLMGVSCSVAVATPGHIYLIGGSLGVKNPVNSVSMAVLAPGGSIQSWGEGPPLPVKLWFHCAAALQGKVYVWSGLTGPDPNEEWLNKVIYISTIQPDGSLGAWEQSPQGLDRPFYSASCTISGNYLLSFCPRYIGANTSGDVWYSKVTPQGISPWVQLPCDAPVKLYTGVATDYQRGNVYLPGGRLSKANYKLDPTVYYFPLSAGKSVTRVASASAGAVPASSAAQLDPAPQQAVAVSGHEQSGANPAAATGPAYSGYSSMTSGSGTSTGFGAQAPGSAIASGAGISSATQGSLQGGAPAAAPGTGKANPGALGPVSSDIPQGFVNVQTGQQMYQKGKTALVFYFYEAGSAASQSQVQNMANFNTRNYQSKVIFTAVDAKQFPQLIQQYNITKLPSWLFIDAQGNLIDRKHRELQTAEIANAVQLIMP